MYVVVVSEAYEVESPRGARTKRVREPRKARGGREEE